MIDTPVSDGTRPLAQPAAGEPTLTELVSGIADDAQRLIRQQYQMLRAELREDIRRTKSALTYMSAGIVAALIGVVFLVVALPLLINWAFNLPPWAAWAIIGLVMLVLGIIGLFAGKRIFEKNNPLPDKTLNALEENLFMDRESPELIEREMEETRESLTEKVSLLEQQVVGKLQSATDAVQETVQSVRCAVDETVAAVSGTVKQSVESVSEGVKEALDVKKHVREYPWAMVAGAAAAGLVTGMLIFRRATPPASLPAYAPMPAAASQPAFTPAPAPSRPGWLSGLFEVVRREFTKIAEQALATTIAKLKQSVETGIPKLIESALPNVGACHESDGPTNTHHGNGPSYSGMRR